MECLEEVVFRVGANEGLCQDLVRKTYIDTVAFLRGSDVAAWDVRDLVLVMKNEEEVSDEYSTFEIGNYMTAFRCGRQKDYRT